MKNVAVRLSEDQVETLDEEADDLDMSRAEYIRDLIEKGRELEEVRKELEEGSIDEILREYQITPPAITTDESA